MQSSTNHMNTVCNTYIVTSLVTGRPYNLYCVGADLKPCSINP